MKTKKSISIEQVEEHFLNWRGYPIKSRIPEELWVAACYLTQRFSVAHVCKRLGLNAGVLRRKIESIPASLVTEDYVNDIQW